MNGIQQIAAKGRYGDNHLLHVSDAELQGLNALANEKFGRGLTTNPDTGLPEAFLFAPLLAPMLAPALGAAAGIGSTALATGLTAGALGTAEAAARGMDDPLQRGLMAGLTAGAGSALGESLAGAADTGTQLGAESAMDASQQAVLNQTQQQAAEQAAAKYAAEGATTQVPTTTALRYPGPGVQGAPTPITTPTPYNAPGMPKYTPEGLEEIMQVESDIAQGAYTAPRSMFGQYVEAPKAFQGAKNILSDKSGQALGTFAKENTMPLAAGAVGLGGQAQLDYEQSMREKREAMDQEKADKLKATQDVIRRNYAAAGRPMPTNPYTGRTIFQNGGIVGLMEGGRPFDLAPGKMSPEEQAFLAALMGGADSDKMKAEADALKESKEKKYADGGSVRPGYTTNIYGEQIPVTRWNGNSSVGGKGGMLGQLFGQMFNGLNSQIKQDLAANAPESKHDAFVGKLQTGMGNQKALDELEKEGYYNGGYLQTGGRVGDGMSDDIPATIDGDQPAALSDGEFVIPADVVSHLGNGSSDAGAQQLYSMMDRIRQARTGTTEQGKEINAKKMMPA
jgi:hypothetical protein